GQWSRGKAVTILVTATAFVALLSEFLVGTIENVRHSVGLTEVFVGVIVVAIVGNAAEHSTAILMAMKNK
ncbi:MAG: cation transporter, partial [Chthoniobacterales bacterium]